MASNVYRGLTIEIDGKTDKLTAALSRVNGEVKTANNSLAGLNRALKIDPGNITLMGDKVKAAGAKVDATKKRVDSLTQAQQRLAASGDTDSATYQRLGKDIATSQVYLDKYTKELGQARVEYSAQESALGRLGTRLTEVGKTLEPIGQRAETIGRALTGTLTVGAVSASVAATNLALSFDTAMSQLAGALGEPVDKLGDLRELAIQTGQDTIYSAQESAGAMVELAKGGLTEADIAGGALASTMDLAAAGSLGLSDAADAVVQTMGAFHLGADEVVVAVNALAGGANASSADVGDLTQALSQVSAVAYGAGWSISDTVAALASFADAGIKGSDAGTSLKSMLTKLEGPSDAAAEAMDAYGISLYEADGSMKSVGEVADNLKEGLSGLSNEERNAALTTIFGSDAVRAANVLYNEGSEGLSKYTDATEDQTSAQTMATAQMGEGQRAIEDAKGAIETAGIELGENFAPIVAEAAGAVGHAAEQFGNLDSQAQVAVVGVAALAGPITTVAGKVLKGTKQVGEGLTRAAQFFAKLGGAADDASASELAAATATGVLRAALATVGTTVAVMAIAELVSEFQKAQQYASNLTEATTGLKSATSNATQEIEHGKSAVQDLSQETAASTESVSDAVSAQAQLAGSIENTNSEAAANVSQLQSAKDVIDEYANKTDLSTQAQGELQAAIQIVNAQCGTQYSVVDAANGKIEDQTGAVQDDTDAIDQLIAKQQEQIRVQALTSELTDLYSQQETDIKAVTEAQQVYNDAQEKYNELSDEHFANPNDYTTTAKWHDAKDAVDAASSSLNDAKSAADANSSSIGNLNTELGNVSATADGTASDLQEFASSTLGEYMTQGVETAGGSLDNFMADLASTGVSTEQLKTLSSDQLAQLGLSYDGTTGSIITALGGMIDGFDTTAAQTNVDVSNMSASIQSLSDNGKIDLSSLGMSAGDLSQSLSDAGVTAQAQTAVANGAFAGMLSQSGGDINSLISILQGYNSTPIVDKDGNVTVNETSLTDAQGNVYTWNGTTVLDKDGNAVVDDLSLTDAQGNLVTWNGSSLSYQSSSATVDDGSLATAQGRLDNWDSSYLVDQNGSANVDDSSLQNAIYKRNDWNNGDLWDKTATAIINFVAGGGGGFGGGGGGGAFASGGIRTHADGGIRYHASGYIATKAQFLPRDVVGEDGAEAIVPLTNRHYVRPFARAVAEEMSSMMPRSAQATLAQQASMAEAIGKALSGTTASGASQTNVTISAPTKIVASDEDVYVARTISDRALMSTVASYL